MKMEIEAINKTQTKGILKMKILGKKTDTRDTNIFNTIGQMEQNLRQKIQQKKFFTGQRKC